MKKKSSIILLLFISFSCKKNDLPFSELFIASPLTLEAIQNSKYQFYKGDTIKSEKKISNDSIAIKFSYTDEKSDIKKELIKQMYYVVPQIYSNITAIENELPYRASYDPINNKEFYNYIRSNKNSEFKAYVVNNNKVVFRDYIKDFKKGNNNISNKKQLFDYLSSNNIKYSLIKDNFDQESQRQYFTIKIKSDSNTSINKLTLSKYEFEMRTYYESDTIPDWNKVTYEIFRY